MSSALIGDFIGRPPLGARERYCYGIKGDVLAMPKGKRTKALSFRLWKEGKSLAEIQVQICGDSKALRESVKEWIVEWERGRQTKWDPDISN
jgi:hypothetical protein